MTASKAILVTGASRGIGAACAIRLGQAGHNVCVHFNSNHTMADAVATTIRQHGSEATTLQFDVCNREQTQTALENYVEQHGAFYGVVCNAGITKDNAFPALSGDDWDRVIHTNLDSFYNVLNPLVMPMIRLRQGGRIVTLSSVSGIMGNRGQTNYSASKAGLIGASKALAIELAKRKITVNCVAPGVIESDMTDDGVLAEAKKAIPMQRFGKVEEVAGLVNFLISDEASYITRQVISVNGGMQ